MLAATMVSVAPFAIVVAGEQSGPPARRQSKRMVASGPYQSKIPTTEADHERVRLAAERRARKVARQALGFKAEGRS
jgi:hypothetical protein